MKSINEYTIFKDLDLIVEYLKGAVDNYLIHLLAQKIFQDSNFNPDQVFLIDLTDSTVGLSPSSAKEILDGYFHLMKFGGEKKVALLTEPELKQNSNEFLSVINSSPNMFVFKVFVTVEEALVWLGITTDNSLIVQDGLKKLRSKY